VRDRLEDRVLVERRERQDVDHLGVDPLGGELVGRVEAHADHAPDAAERHVAAAPDDLALTDGERVRLLGDLAARAGAEELVLEEHDRAVVADRRDHQPLGVVRGRRDDDLEPRDVGQDRVHRLGVLGGRAAAVGG
jgi:hypothetical protein